MHYDTLIVAIGGAGRAIVEAFGEHIDADLLVINAQAQLSTIDAGRSVSLQAAGREGAFYSVSQARTAALLKQDQIAARLEKFQRIILTVGLGGSTGSGVAPVIARLASELNKDVLAAVTLPFAIEGGRIAIAHKTLAELGLLCNEILVHDHENASSSMPSSSLEDALQDAANRLGQQIQWIFEVLDSDDHL